MLYEIYHVLGSHRGLLAALHERKHASWDVHLKTAESDSGTLSLTTTTANPEFPYLAPMRSEIVVERAGVEYWRGRYLEPHEELAGTVQLTVKGCLDYLRDTVLSEHNLSCSAADAFSELITEHNSKPIEANKRFIVGVCEIDAFLDEFKITAGDKTWDVFKRLLRQCGGKLRLRRADGANVIDWITYNSHTCSQAVRLGINLVDMVKELDVSDLATVIYAYGKVTEDVPLDICSVNDGLPYVSDASAVAAFGWIEDSIKERSIEDAAALKAAAEEDLFERLAAVQSIELQAVDLADVSDAEQIEVNMDVAVFLRDMELTMPCVEIDRYFFEPTKTKISLGTTLRALSDLIGG